MAKEVEAKKLLEKQLKDVEAESKQQRAEMTNLKRQNDRLAQQVADEQERVKEAMAQAAEAAKVSQPSEQRQGNGSRHQLDGQGSLKQPSKDSIISNKPGAPANGSDRAPSEAGASKTLL